MSASGSRSHSRPGGRDARRLDPNAAKQSAVIGDIRPGGEDAPVSSMTSS